MFNQHNWNQGDVLPLHFALPGWALLRPRFENVHIFFFLVSLGLNSIHLRYVTQFGITGTFSLALLCSPITRPKPRQVTKIAPLLKGGFSESGLMSVSDAEALIAKNNKDIVKHFFFADTLLCHSLAQPSAP